jgi:hypothetical protein
VAVKLNSADFQRGGFSPEDAQAVVAMLAPSASIWWNCPAAATKRRP